MLTSYREGGNHTKYQNLRIIFERLENSNHYDDPKATANFITEFRHRTAGETDFSVYCELRK